MADEAIQRYGLYFDELNKIRVLDPDVNNQTTELKESCKDFVDRISEFQKIVGGFIQMVQDLGDTVEKEKLKAIGSRNMMKSIAKQREAQEQQLRALITEKKTELERLRMQHESLVQVVNQQDDYVEKFIQ